MTTPDLYRPRLDAMIDMQHPLAVLSRRLSWSQIEVALAPAFERRNCSAQESVPLGAPDFPSR